MEKVLIVNAYGRSNRGDSVLLDECIMEIRVKYPGCQVSCALFEGLENAQSIHPDVHWTTRIGNAKGGAIGRLRSLSYLFLALLMSAFRVLWFVRLLPDGQQQTMRAFRHADVIVSAPGGYIHDTNFAYFIALAHIYFGVLCGKKVVLAPQSIGPIKSRISRFLAKFVLSRSSAVCVRESYSEKFVVNELGVPKQLVLRAGDSAFWNRNEVFEKEALDKNWSDANLPVANEQPILGITVVGWTFPHSSSPDEEMRKYLQDLARVIDDAVFAHGVVPVVFNQVSDDLDTAIKLSEYCKSKIYIDRVSREADILRGMIRRSAFFIGTRFHSCIFALMAGVPTYAIAYLPKTKYILKDLGLERCSSDITDVRPAEVTRALDQALQDRNKAMKEVAECVSKYQANFARLRDALPDRMVLS